MNFRSPQPDDTLDINLIPLIDVLLVILIFLAATTSFTRFQEMKLQLPQAAAEAPEPDALEISVDPSGNYSLGDQALGTLDTTALSQALRAVKQTGQSVLVIRADARSPHETVVRVMEAARQAGIERVNIATQGP